MDLIFPFKIMSNIVINRLGTVDIGIVEANPVVFRGRLLRFEYIREGYRGVRSGSRPDRSSFFRLVDWETGEIVSEFGHNFHMGCAMVWQDRVYVSCNSGWGSSSFYLMSSSDLQNWSGPDEILSNPEWKGFNTSICRAGNDFVMVFELGGPEELVGCPFTMFFARSSDLRHWSLIPGAVYGREVYCGAPMLRYFDGYYYFFHLSGDYENGFNTFVARSVDLKNWSEEKSVLPFDDCDRKILFPAEESQRRLIETAKNINASDLDMCEYGGKLHMTYSWGDQNGTEFLAVAAADCGEAEFCRSFWGVM